MLSVIYSDEYVTITLDAAKAILRYARTATAYPTIDALRAHRNRATEAFSAIEPARLGLLLDLRAAPPRNDAAFEAEVIQGMNALVARFRTHAFLVKTAVGSLQVRRLNHDRNATIAVFSDEAEALRHLAAGA